MLKFKTSCGVLAYLSSNLLNEVGLSLFRYSEVGLRVCDIVVKKFTFAISSPDEFLLANVNVLRYVCYMRSHFVCRLSVCRLSVVCLLPTSSCFRFLLIYYFQYILPLSTHISHRLCKLFQANMIMACIKRLTALCQRLCNICKIKCI